MKFKPGSYTAELIKPAKIKAKVIVDTDKIKEVRICSAKDERKIEPELEKIFTGQIIDAQSVNIDGVSSASVLTKAIKTVVGEALAEARLE